MTQPLCQYFGTCGGCMFQHVPYEQQLEQKKQALQNATGCKNIKIIPGEPYHYRNRMDFIFTKQGLGLRQKGQWNKIVDIEQCVISTPKINELLVELRTFFKDVEYFDIKRKAGTYKYAIIRAPQNDSSITFVLNEDSMQLGRAIDKIKAYAESSTANNILVVAVPAISEEVTDEEPFVAKGTEFLAETLQGKTFRYSIQGFFQNNSAMAEEMHRYVREILKTHQDKGSTLLDLYAGVGTFGIINADLFKEVIIVESFPSCIDAANENILHNHIENATAHALDAKNLAKLSLPKDLVVVNDPPRSGMHPKAIQELNHLKPKAIIYISCNVQQLAKELPHFKDYTIGSVALVDLFPQTPHSEAVVELVRKDL